MNENPYNKFTISEVTVWISSDCSVILQVSLKKKKKKKKKKLVERNKKIQLDFDSL